ncbi:MAG: DUF4910 domain-containing protein [Lentisphaeraceae bacterium]|nr:DUF4910 domain-containing protein [Lentisphaeraceae bacterium]
MKEELNKFLKRLFPICRSITGEGNRESLKILQEIIPLEIKECPSGKEVFDWTVPPEWNIRSGWIKDCKGETIIDFKELNLHVVSYSVPVDRTMKGKDLKKKLHYIQEKPETVPYRTTYYKRDWGFCLSYNDYEKIEDDQEYKVFIDSDLNPEGSLSYGELLLPGCSSKEFLISTYICHPSLGNDNLSGVIATAFLVKELMKSDLKYSYRIVFIPETIGAIVYSSVNKSIMEKIDCGLVITTCGGPGKFGYKQSFDKSHILNSITEDVFRKQKIMFETYPFVPDGSDERQYSSPGFKINTVTITKDKYYEYEEYHTSDDNLNFINSENLAKSIELYKAVIDKYEEEVFYKSLKPFCEVMLSKHDLYPKLGGSWLPGKVYSEIDILSWLMHYCDGKVSLNEISNLTGIKYSDILKTAIKMKNKGILEEL